MAAAVLKGALGIDAEQVINGGRQIVRAHRVRRRIGAVLVAGAEDLAAGDAGAGQREAEHGTPVIAPSLTVDPRRSAELADGDNQRLMQQTALLQVLQQGGEADVELGAEHVLKPLGVLGVRVPHRVVHR